MTLVRALHREKERERKEYRLFLWQLVYRFWFQVSWVRHRDIHLLTVGRYTYTSDQRFEALHLPHAEEWTLRIRYPQRKDSGIYECQISTTPPIGHPVYLTIVGKRESFETKMENFISLEVEEKFFFFSKGRAIVR